MPTLPISNGFYVSDSLPISNQQCVNFRPNVPQSDTVTVDNLFGTEGIGNLARAATLGITRGAHVMAGIPYFVIGSKLYELTRTFVLDIERFSLDEIGDIDGISRVYMADNGTQLCIVSPPLGASLGKSYIYTSGVLSEITDSSFDGPASSVVYIDGYFSFHKSDGKKFFNSPLLDGRGLPSGTAYNALDFQTAAADPDQIRGQAVYRNQLYIGGSETFEVFRNIGRDPSPFQRIPGAVIDVGLSAPFTLRVFADNLVFVGAGREESPAVWVIAGSRKTKLSTTAIDNELSKLTDSEIQNIFSWVYAESGAYFYGITLPETTFVYDSINNRWHERQSITNSRLTQYRVSTMTQAYGRIIVGDLQERIVGELRKGLYTEYGRIIKRFVTSKPFDNEGDPIFVSSVEAVCESGVGLKEDINLTAGTNISGVPIIVTGGEDPRITYSWSDDGGRTFKGDLSRSLGKIGEYKKRQIWNRGGRFPRSRVLKFEISAPVKATLIKVEAEIG